MTCLYCKGRTQAFTTTYTVRHQNFTITIKSVPCEKCSLCGEGFFNGETLERIEKIIGKFKDMGNITVDYATMPCGTEVPSPDDIAAIQEGRADRAKHGTVSHDVINWD